LKTYELFESHQYYPIAIRGRVWDTLTESQKTMALEDDYKMLVLEQVLLLLRYLQYY
jgi:hypothetical protein